MALSTPSAMSVAPLSRGERLGGADGGARPGPRGAGAEAAGDLDVLGVEGGEHLEGGVAVADVVGGEAHPVLAIGAGDHLETLEVGDRLLLGELEDHVLGRATRPAEQEQELVDLVDRVEEGGGADVEEEGGPRGEAAASRRAARRQSQSRSRIRPSRRAASKSPATLASGPTPGGRASAS